MMVLITEYHPPMTSLSIGDYGIGMDTSISVIGKCHLGLKK